MSKERTESDVDEFDTNKERFRRLLNVIGILFILELVYLNVLVPLTLSIEQIYKVSVLVALICENKSLGVSNLSPKQLDEILELAVKGVEGIFRKVYTFSSCRRRDCYSDEAFTFITTFFTSKFYMHYVLFVFFSYYFT
jgi:hypothetical protein